jgi:hypothetical protein
MPKVIKLDSIRLDIDAQRNGEWKPIARWPGVRVKVRGFTSEAYVKARDAALEKLAEQFGGTRAPKEIWIPILARLLVGGSAEVSVAIDQGAAILLDWDGFDEAFTADFAAEFMGSPEGENMLDEVLAAARTAGVRELQFVEALEKNSAALSGTR